MYIATIVYIKFFIIADSSSLLYKEVKNESVKRIFYYDRELTVSIIEITYNIINNDK